MNWAEVKSTLEGIGVNFEAFKKRYGEELEALKAECKNSREFAEEVKALVDDLLDREAMARIPGKGRVNDAARKQLNAYLHGDDRALTKDLSIAGGTSAGAGLVPEVLASEILQAAVNEEPILAEIRISESATGDYKRAHNRKGTTSGWVGETDARERTNTSQFRELAPPGGELYNYPRATEWMVNDSAFDIASIVIEDTGEEFATQMAGAVLLGNGTNKPRGLLLNTPVTTADTTPDTRDANTLRYVTNEGSPNVLDTDLLITALFDLKAGYRRRAIWCMNSLTLAHCRKLKDANGRYLWESGGFSGGIDAPDGFLLGKRVVISEQMPNVGAGAGNFPVLVGDFKRGYELVNVGGVRITVDASITEPGFHKWYIRRRVLGTIADNNAIRAIRT